MQKRAHTRLYFSNSNIAVNNCKNTQLQLKYLINIKNSNQAHSLHHKYIIAKTLGTENMTFVHSNLLYGIALLYLPALIV